MPISRTVNPHDCSVVIEHTPELFPTVVSREDVDCPIIPLKLVGGEVAGCSAPLTQQLLDDLQGVARTPAPPAPIDVGCG